MHQLAYISAAAPAVGEKDLSRILKSARKNNPASGITGILMFHHGQFLQVLEGPKAAIEACFARIKADGRHRSIIKLYDEAAEERCFADWSMAVFGLSDCDSSLREQLIDLFEMRSHPRYEDLQKNKVIGVFVDTFLADMNRFGDSLDLPKS